MTRRGIRTEKGLDEFQKTAMPFFDWLIKHQMYAWGAFGAVVLVLLGLWGFAELKDHSREKRLIALSKIDSLIFEEQKQVTKLREPLTKELENLKDDKGDTKQKREEIEAKIYAIRVDESKYFDQYREFFNANKSHPEGWNAGLRAAGNGIRESKRTEDALKLLNEVLVASKKEPTYQLLGQRVLASYYEDQGQLDLALNAIQEALKLAGQESKAGLLFDQARIYAAQNNKEKAAETLEVILKEHASSNEVSKARALKAVL